MKNSIAKDTVKMSISKMSVMVISMITVFLLSRFRTLEEYGTYSQILIVANIVTAFFMLGLPNSINYFLAKSETEEEKQRFLSTYFTLSTVISLATGLTLVLSTPLIVSYFENDLIKNFMYFFSVYPWTAVILSGIDNICVVYKRINTLIVFRILNGFSLILIIILVELLDWSFAAYMILYIIVQSIFALSIYLIAGKFATNLRYSFEKVIVSDIFKFSVPLGLSSFIGTITILMGTLFIGRYFNTEQLAIYANAAREMPVTLIASSLTAVLLPHMVYLLKKNQYEGAVILWGECTSLSYVIICFIATGIFVYAPEVISLLYSDKYLPGVPIFRIYCIVLLLRCTYFGMILNSLGKTKLILYSSIASLGINAILMFVFYYIFGYIGPAIATLFTITLVALFQLKATSVSLNIKFTKIFPWRTIMLITLVNILLGVAFAGIKSISPMQNFCGEILESLTLGIAWTMVYGLIMIKFVRKKWDVLNEKN